MPRFWTKAQVAAKSAHRLFEADSLDGACNRAYYAMFNAARALLEQRGLDMDQFKTHGAVLRLFSLHFVRTGRFTVELGCGFADAGQARNLADYSSQEIELVAVSDVIAPLDAFMAVAHRVIDEHEARGGET